MITPTTRLRTSRGASSNTLSTSPTALPASDKKQPAPPAVLAHKSRIAPASSASAAVPSSSSSVRVSSPPAEMRRLAIKQPLPPSTITSTSTRAATPVRIILAPRHTAAASSSIIRPVITRHPAAADRPASTSTTATSASLLRPTRSAPSVTVHPARPQLPTAPFPSSSVVSRPAPPSLSALLPPASSLSFLPAPPAASKLRPAPAAALTAAPVSAAAAPVSSLSSLSSHMTPSAAASSSPPLSAPSHSRRLSVEDTEAMAAALRTLKLKDERRRSVSASSSPPHSSAASPVSSFSPVSSSPAHSRAASTLTSPASLVAPTTASAAAAVSTSAADASPPPPLPALPPPRAAKPSIVLPSAVSASPAPSARLAMAASPALPSARAASIISPAAASALSPSVLRSLPPASSSSLPAASMFTPSESRSRSNSVSYVRRPYIPSASRRDSGSMARFDALRRSQAEEEEADDADDGGDIKREKREALLEREEKEEEPALVQRRGVASHSHRRITPIHTLPHYASAAAVRDAQDFSASYSASPGSSPSSSVLSSLSYSPSPSPSPPPAPSYPPPPPPPPVPSSARSLWSLPSLQRGVVGLINVGNTCFFASAMQCLLSIPPLLSFFASQAYRADINTRTKAKGQLAVAFAQLCSAVAAASSSSSSSSPSALSPSPLLRVFTALNSSFAGYGQHDAQECLRCFLSSLHEEVNRVQQPPPYEQLEDVKGESEAEQAARWWRNHCQRNDSAVVDLFAGQLRSEVSCSVCRHRSVCFDPFLDLSLPIAQQPAASPSKKRSSPLLSLRRRLWSSDDDSADDEQTADDTEDEQRPPLSLQDCITAFTRAEALSGDNAIYCRHCKQHQPSVKQLSVYRLPAVLVLHLKRFSFDVRGLGGASRRKLDTMVRFPLQLEMTDALSGRSHRYQLVAVSNHTGSTAGGHYTAHGRVGKDWWLFNDSRCSRLDDAQELQTRSAYILCYQRDREQTMQKSAL